MYRVYIDTDNGPLVFNDVLESEVEILDDLLLDPSNKVFRLGFENTKGIYYYRRDQIKGVGIYPMEGD